MANDLSARPWYIDTPAAGVVIWPHQIYIKFIEVVGGQTAAPTAGNQAASVTDRNGKRIIDSYYQTSQKGELQTFNLENWFQGLIVSFLDNTTSGTTMRIHIK